MMHIRSILAPTSLVNVPKIYHFDTSNQVIIMEDCGPEATSLEDFLSGDTSSPQVAETIGTALGEFILSVHEWSRNNPIGVLDTFDKNSLAKMTTAEFYYNHLVTTLQGSDLNLKVDPFDIQVISDITDEYRSRMMSAWVPGRDVVSP